MLLGDAGADVASVDCEAEVLGGDVALPLVFGAEGSRAAVEVKAAGERADVFCFDVFV